jgi:hypothetical protein
MRAWTILLCAAFSLAACDSATEPEARAEAPASDPRDEAPEAPEVVETDFLAVLVGDPPGDNTGPSDIDYMRLAFNKYTGEYRITIEAYADAPFRDSLRVNINLLNYDLGTDPNPAFFSDTMNDMMIAGSVTTLVLTGVDARLTAWKVGHRVFTNSLDGTPNPDGSSLYRSSVTHFPMGFLTNEDVIAFPTRYSPAVVMVADGLE